jgi:hypothetical protein
MDKARELGRRFADEPFQWSIADAAGILQKPIHHEAYTGYTESTTFDKEYVRNNLHEFVILNHNSLDILLRNTHTFLLRQDLSQIAESWFYLFEKTGHTRDASRDIFSFALNNMVRVCEHLLSIDHPNVIRCESMYKFTPRETQLYFPEQKLINEVYRKYS